MVRAFSFLFFMVFPQKKFLSNQTKILLNMLNLHFFPNVILILISVANLCLCEDYQTLVTRIEKLETEQNEKIVALEFKVEAYKQSCQGHSQTLETLFENLATIEENLNVSKSDLVENSDQLSSLKQKLNNGFEKIDNLVKVTDILSSQEFCWKFGSIGFIESGVFPIDPDGLQQNLPPITAFCSLPDGKTTLG